MRSLTSTFLTTLLALGAQAAVIPRQTTTNASSAGPISLSVYLPGSALNGLPLNAAGEKFILGGSPSSYCPLPPADCAAYPGNETWVGVGQGTMFMSVSAPGGQQAYIAPDGSLSFTIAHEEDIFPPGSLVTNFTYTPPTPGGGLSVVNFAGNGSTAWVACENAQGLLQVYANVVGGEWDACTPFVAGVSHESGVNSFEYT